MGKSMDFRSDHFTLEQLAQGVYAAINSPSGWAICNAGIIDLGDRTLIYDGFMTPAAASDLRSAAETLLGRPVHALINSHYHNDHIWGNQAFSPDTEIISTTMTRQLIITEGPKEIQAYREVVQTRLESVEAQLTSDHDEATLKNLQLHHAYFQGIQATLPGLQLRLPDITFTGNLTFEGSKRCAQLLTFEGGHCSSDAILYLPQDGIVFMEDLLFKDFHPYLEECDPAQLKLILGEVKKLGAKIFVPGHGPLAEASQLDWMLDYIECLDTLAGEVVNQGGTETDLGKIVIPIEYQCLLFPQMFPANLKFMYKRRISV
jgi:cyclase